MQLNVYKHLDLMLNTLMEAINYMISSDNIEINIQLLNDSKLVLDAIDLTLTINSKSITNTIIFQQLIKCKIIIDSLIEINTKLDKEILEELDIQVKNLQIMFHQYVE